VAGRLRTEPGARGLEGAGPVGILDPEIDPWPHRVPRPRPTRPEPTPPIVEAMFMESRVLAEPMPAMASKRAARASGGAVAGRSGRGRRVRGRGGEGGAGGSWEGGLGPGIVRWRCKGPRRERGVKVQISTVSGEGKKVKTESTLHRVTLCISMRKERVDPCPDRCDPAIHDESQQCEKTPSA
jgi:hypothetical protein